MPAALRLGLTGGIGSGKSTVAALLQTQGAHVIDADALARATTAAGGAAIPAIQEAFGPGLLNAAGALDRDKMRQLAFSDASTRTRLEAIVHPLVGAAIEQEAQDAETKGTHCLVFDIPLLVESAHWRQRLHRVLVVDCSSETQIQRVMQRNGMSRSEVQNIMAAQAKRTQRLRAADAVLFNDGISLDALALHVQQIGRQFGL
ncbi:dephospho-CoA kinase [Rhodoferax sp. TH121]|uniref:dephospho-CoA kinase n=1 Tax=Rhodoferax sp. TH121 TaxID=2022803 RepID=UPI000B95FD57|nr:dephospho-CoA kinase [Rhodoferax sp. TH121]OYQ39320.1 dephospho-CoA kinase [Rhodoferax sp. TH121]